MKPPRIEWLKSAPDGVIAEAVGGGYTVYGRISEYTGLPTVINWPDHESQWGRTGAELGTRQDDIKTLYSYFRLASRACDYQSI